MAKKLKPVHPGEILREEFMKSLGLSMNKLALDLRVPVTRIAEIVHERRAISTDTALRLGRYFDTTPAFWMNLQVRYDLEVAEDELAQRIARDVPSPPSGYCVGVLSSTLRRHPATASATLGVRRLATSFLSFILDCMPVYPGAPPDPFILWPSLSSRRSQSFAVRQAAQCVATSPDRPRVRGQIN